MCFFCRRPSTLVDKVTARAHWTALLEANLAQPRSKYFVASAPDRCKIVFGACCENVDESSAGLGVNQLYSTSALSLLSIALSIVQLILRPSVTR